MPEQPPTLSDMIKKEHERGVRYDELAERTADPTGKPRISKSQLNKIANGEKTPLPNETQLRGIAAALQLPYDLVRRAAINQWLPADDSAVGVPDLPEDEREQLKAEAIRLRAIADEALARIDRQTGGGGSTRRQSA